MKAMQRVPVASRSFLSALFLAYLAVMATGTDLRADGCFVLPPFVWSRTKDINEPTQKAILLYDAGREDMVLQVKYEGPVTEFGWLIPVPSQPEIAVASMASFYELSRFTQEYVHHRERVAFAGSGGSGESLRPITVLEYFTVGAYDVAVLAAESADSLAAWLLENHFAFRQGSQTALGSYLEKRWFIVAIRVHLDQKGGQIRRGVSPNPSSKQTLRLDVSEALRIGELHPIRISFDTPQCIFPLKVSSLNGKASEVLLYVLSVEPLTCAGLVKPVHHTDASGPGYDLPGELDSSFPAGAVEGDRLPKSSVDLPRLSHRKWTFAKFQRVFRPDEMEDLGFQSMFPLLRTNLESTSPYGSRSYSARLLLGSFEELATPFFPDLAGSSFSENRETCCAMLHAYHPKASLEVLLKLLDDADASVRFEACWAAEFYNDPRVVSKLLALLKVPRDAS
jgi:hypothetical protein